MKNSADKVEFKRYDDLFGSTAGADIRAMGIRTVKLEELYEFHGHPFKVIEDESMLELVESVKERGVLVPGLVRARNGDGYEVIAGHRRKYASILAGKDTMQVICQNLTDDDATIIMVDSNIQRENLLPSEKAFAYQMKMKALKHQGKKGMGTAQKVGEKAGDKARTVQRYIRLTYLESELLEAVDHRKIAFIAGADLSFLKKNEQKWVSENVKQTHKYPNGSMAIQLKEYSERGKLTKELAELILMGTEKRNMRIVIKNEQIREYFPESYDQTEIEKIIFSLLRKWKAKGE
jgi:ParB-like partition proteins